MLFKPKEQPKEQPNETKSDNTDALQLLKKAYLNAAEAYREAIAIKDNTIQYLNSRLEVHENHCEEEKPIDIDRYELRIATLIDQNNELAKELEEKDRMTSNLEATNKRLEDEKKKLQDVIEKLTAEMNKGQHALSENQKAELARLKRNEYQRRYMARKRAERVEKQKQV